MMGIVDIQFEDERIIFDTDNTEFDLYLDNHNRECKGYKIDNHILMDTDSYGWLKLMNEDTPRVKFPRQ